MRERLQEIIREKSYATGKTFTLASGKTSPYYFNMKPTMMDAEGAYLLGECLADAVAPFSPDYVGGMAVGAIPLVTVAAAASYRRAGKEAFSAFFIRKQAKDHGTEQTIEGLSDPESLKGKNVVMIEDVTTTGGSVLLAIEKVRGLGGNVSHVVTVLDRQEGAEANLTAENISLHSLFTASEIAGG